MSLLMFFFVPAVVFLALVAPVWLLLHYWTKNRLNKGLSDEECQALDRAISQVEKLEQRIKTLETILDVQHPNWRHYEEDVQRRNDHP